MSAGKVAGEGTGAGAGVGSANPDTTAAGNARGGTASASGAGGAENLPDVSEAVGAFEDMSAGAGANADIPSKDIPPGDGGSSPWPDESMESAMLGELRERGETVVPPGVAQAGPGGESAGSAEEKETDKKALPPLDSLVQRIPPEVRETLEDLFRAKFVTVRRVPKKALK